MPARDPSDAWRKDREIFDRAARTQRFVEDWRALSAEQASDHSLGLERQRDRMIARMQRNPALERAVDRADPELHLQIEELGRSRDMQQSFDIGI